MAFYITVDNLSSDFGTAMGVTAQIKKKYSKVRGMDVHLSYRETYALTQNPSDTHASEGFISL